MKRFPIWLVLLVVLGIMGLMMVRLHRSRAPHPPVWVDSPAGPASRIYYDRDGYARMVGQDADDVENEFDDDRQSVRREPAEDLPVPIVPGSRTTEALPEPPARPQPRLLPPQRKLSPRQPRMLPRDRRLHPPAPVGPPGVRTVPGTDLLSVTGRLSANEDRALDDARARLEEVLSERLAPEVPRTWKIPPALLDDNRGFRPPAQRGRPRALLIPPEMSESLIREVTIVPSERDYGTVYEATLKVDFSPRRRAQILAIYHREQVVKRLLILGGVLAFVIACLSAISGYIKADEATKGYYTTSLRLASTLAVGVAALVIYRWLL